jgi:TPR repeat protein
LYGGGTGVKKDDARAKLLFGTACDLGHQEACE